MSAPTLVIFGANGQLGRALDTLTLPPGWGRRIAARTETDITNPGQIERFLSGVTHGLAVNAAAYTAVDKAESEPEQAFAVNRDGPGYLAATTAALGLPLLHVSTDFVFDGAKTSPYDETDTPRPLSVYGASKLAGEIAVAAANPRHLILRTAWVFSAHAGCFPRTIFRLLRQKDEVAVVDDQIGCPTAAEHLAQIIMALAPSLIDRPAADAAFGLFHLGGLPVVSRFDFAQAVEMEARAQGMKLGRVTARHTDPAAAGAHRPANSALSSAKFTAIHGIPAPDWREILPACVRTYGESA